MGTKRVRVVLAALVTIVGTALAVVPAGSASATSDTISGTITAEGGGDVSYTGIEVFTPDPDGAWEWLKIVETDANGHFSLLLPHGQYRLEFLSFDSIHVPVFYGGASDVDSATTVDNSSGPMSGIDGVLPIGGKIVGTVPQLKGTTGAVYAFVESSPGQWKSVWANGLTFTDRVDGGFTFTALPTGNYKIWFSPYDDTYGPEYYADSPDLAGATPIAVTNGSTSGPINATLPLNGKITGHVITSAGADLGGVIVVPFQKVDGTWQKVLGAQDTTDSHGRYSIPLGGGTYRIKFTDSKAQRAFEYWPNKRTIGQASSFTVTAGKTTTSKNAIMERAARIAGTVTYPAGVPGSATIVENNVEGTITLYDAATGEVVKSKYVFARVGEGDAFGYSLAGIPAGKYRIAFARDVGASNVEARFYNGKPESVAAKASILTVTSGQDRTGVNATMRIGGTLTGYVLRSDGSPATGCMVHAYTGDNSRVTRIAEIGSDGRFRVQGLTTGAYRLAVFPSVAEDDPLSYRAHCKDVEYYQGGSGALSKSEADGIAVHVTATRDTLLGTPLYYGLGTAPSLPTIQNTALPSITGTAHAGQTLTASPGVWSPAPDQVRYQWLRDGLGIAGQVGSKYLLRAADQGHKISVRVSAYVFGQNPNTAVSAAKTVS